MQLEVFNRPQPEETVARFTLMQRSGYLTLREVKQDGSFVKDILDITPEGIRLIGACHGGSLPVDPSRDNQVKLTK